MMADQVRVVMRPAEIRQWERGSDKMRALVRLARPYVAKARAAAPRSRTGSHGRAPGYLARGVTLRVGQDSNGIFLDIVATARTPKGFPYGRLWEQRKRYIRRSIGR